MGGKRGKFLFFSEGGGRGASGVSFCYPWRVSQ